MSSAKLHLTIASSQDFFFAGTSLIGISCRQPDYRMVWRLNQCLDMGFYRDPDLDLPMKKGDQCYHFSIFVYPLPMSSGNYIFYVLRQGNQHLVPELRNHDYLWLFQSNQSEEEARFYLPYIRQIPEVQLAQIYKPEALKSRANLIL